MPELSSASLQRALYTVDFQTRAVTCLQGHSPDKDTVQTVAGTGKSLLRAKKRIPHLYQPQKAIQSQSRGAATLIVRFPQNNSLPLLKSINTSIWFSMNFPLAKDYFLYPKFETLNHCILCFDMDQFSISELFVLSSISIKPKLNQLTNPSTKHWSKDILMSFLTARETVFLKDQYSNIYFTFCFSS